MTLYVINAKDDFTLGAKEDAESVCVSLSVTVCVSVSICIRVCRL